MPALLLAQSRSAGLVRTATLIELLNVLHPHLEVALRQDLARLVQIADLTAQAGVLAASACACDVDEVAAVVVDAGTVALLVAVRDWEAVLISWPLLLGDCAVMLLALLLRPALRRRRALRVLAT